MRLLPILIIAIFAGSCATSKRCLEKWPPIPVDTIRTVEYRDTTIYRDTIVEVFIPGEIQVDTVPIPCPDLPTAYVPDTAKAQTRLAQAKAWMEDGKIILELEQNDQWYQAKIEDAIRERDRYRKEIEEIRINHILEVKKPSRYHRFMSAGFWTLIGLFVIWLLIKYLFKK